MIRARAFYVYKANHGPGSATHFHEAASITLIVRSFRHSAGEKRKTTAAPASRAPGTSLLTLAPQASGVRRGPEIQSAVLKMAHSA